MLFPENLADRVTEPPARRPTLPVSFLDLSGAVRECDAQALRLKVRTNP